mmetsp:Transcript_30892/g.58653  ORF Transcript_30892/g.58653 Transcript_30892/m.58653 type:complete len:257 (-) Transcript_30892:756-1526(-)
MLVVVIRRANQSNIPQMGHHRQHGHVGLTRSGGSANQQILTGVVRRVEHRALHGIQTIRPGKGHAFVGIASQRLVQIDARAQHGLLESGSGNCHLFVPRLHLAFGSWRQTSVELIVVLPCTLRRQIEFHGLDLLGVHAVESAGLVGVEERRLLVTQHHLLHGAASSARYELVVSSVVVVVVGQLTLEKDIIALRQGPRLSRFGYSSEGLFDGAFVRFFGVLVALSRDGMRTPRRVIVGERMQISAEGGSEIGSLVG